MTGKQILSKTIAILSFILLSSCAHHKSTQIEQYYKLYQLEGDFEDIRDEVVDVIQEKGMVISFVSHAAAMLERTEATVENKGNIYADAEVLLFCKADLSHYLAVSDPHSVILCPHAIAVYTLKENPEIVYLSVRKPPENVDSYQGIFQLLEEIIRQIILENG